MNEQSLQVGSVWRQAKWNVTLEVIEANIPITQRKVIQSHDGVSMKKRKLCFTYSLNCGDGEGCFQDFLKDLALVAACEII